jgi:aryl-alcohol dehydrogenase-like predicted oxidoreductase
MQCRRLGRTGHRSSVAILGGAAFWDLPPSVVRSAFEAALASGVNHLDVAPQYGRAEVLLGPLVPSVRDRLFLACKTLRPDGDGARQELERSLGLFGTDAFDLYQLHAVTGVEELDRRAGAVEAVLAARDEGLCRWVGVTGHELSAPAAHLEALRRYDLDTVMFPVNPRLWADRDYRRDAERLLEECASRDVGVMAIKALAARPWAGRERTAATWYEPYRDEGGVERGVRFTLSVPGVHAFCTPGDLDLLSEVLAAAARFEPMDAGARDAASAEVAGEAHIFPMPA